MGQPTKAAEAARGRGIAVSDLQVQNDGAAMSSPKCTRLRPAVEVLSEALAGWSPRSTLTRRCAGIPAAWHSRPIRCSWRCSANRWFLIAGLQSGRESAAAFYGARCLFCREPAEYFDHLDQQDHPGQQQAVIAEQVSCCSEVGGAETVDPDLLMRSTSWLKRQLLCAEASIKNTCACRLKC